MKLPSILLSAGLMLLAPLASQAQNDSKYGETEEQQLLCKEALSVYKSYKKQKNYDEAYIQWRKACLLYTSPSPRDGLLSRMPSSA